MEQNQNEMHISLSNAIEHCIQVSDTFNWASQMNPLDFEVSLQYKNWAHKFPSLASSSSDGCL